MRVKTIRVFAVSFLVFSLSCNFLTKLTPNGGSSTEPSTPSLVSSGNGPAGLTATSTSPDSVLLSWDAVDGAVAYRIRASINGNPAMHLMDLSASTTRYTDFMAMPNSQLTYAVEAVGDSGSIGQSVVNVSTAARQPHPMAVQAEFDDSAAITQTIGSAGGSISVKDNNGVLYDLSFPPGALLSDNVIQMTPVKNLAGWPLDGDMLGSVKIEPEGLQLDDVATLSITLPGDLPDDKLSTVGFAFSGAGAEFHLQPAYEQKPTTGFVPQSGGAHFAIQAAGGVKVITLPIMELHGNGVGRGSAESAGNLVQNNAPSDSAAAMDQKQAATQAEADDLAPLPKLGDVAASISATAIFSQIYDADDCGSIKSAIVSFQKWRGSSEYNLSQFPDQIQNSDKAIVDSLADKLKDIIDKASEECKKSDGKGPVATAQAGCLESILDHIANPPHTGSGVWGDLQVKMLDKFGNKVVADADNNLAKCLPSYDTSGGSGYTFSGTICSLREPFTLKADGMEHFTVEFTPSSGLSGTMNAVGTGSADGVTCSDGGTGTYIVNLNASGGGNIIVTIPPSTLNCPGVSRSNTVVQVFNITPLAEKPASCSQP